MRKISWFYPVTAVIAAALIACAGQVLFGQARGEAVVTNENTELAVELVGVRPGILGDKVVVSATSRFVLPKELIDALKQGIDLTFLTQFIAFKERLFFVDKTVLDLQLYRVLSYHSLTRRYSVSNKRNQERRHFRSLEKALGYLGTYHRYFITYLKTLSDTDATHMKMQLTLDTASLPLILRLKSYSSPSWILTSDWYKWRIPKHLF